MGSEEKQQRLTLSEITPLFTHSSSCSNSYFYIDNGTDGRVNKQLFANMMTM